MRRTYKGRDIEIIKPTNPYGACAFTLNGDGPREGERFMGAMGQSAEDVLSMIKRNIDETDARGVKGMTTWTVWLRPGSWEVCPNNKGAAYTEHVKPIGAPCLEDECKRKAAKKAAQKARAQQGHPAVAALTRLLKNGGFVHHADGRGLSAGFRVMKNEGGPESGVRVCWYAEGRRMPMQAEPGQAPQIAVFLRLKDRYQVREDGPHVYVVSKTHGVFPDYV